jgi:hypothetical protein
MTALNKKLPFDGFSDRIVLDLASGRRRKSPPVDVIVEHLFRVGRIGFDETRGLFLGMMSDGTVEVLASLMPEAIAVEEMLKETKDQIK